MRVNSPMLRGLPHFNDAFDTDKREYYPLLDDTVGELGVEIVRILSPLDLLAHLARNPHLTSAIACMVPLAPLNETIWWGHRILQQPHTFITVEKAGLLPKVCPIMHRLDTRFQDIAQLCMGSVCPSCREPIRHQSFLSVPRGNFSQIGEADVEMQGFFAIGLIAEYMPFSGIAFADVTSFCYCFSSTQFIV
jgi:hypothetical protein